MGIFEAGRRGHTGEEDMLTSSVFGMLEILDRSKFLAPVLEQCGVELVEDIDLGRLSFNYWESTGKRTPDVILRDKSILISVESKLGSQIDNWQLVEEYEDGIKAQRNFWLIAITADYIQPAELEKAKSVLKEKGFKDPHIKWINWQQIYAFLLINAEGGNETEQKLIDELLALLKAKGLSMFYQFNETQLSNVATLWSEMPKFLEDYSALLGTLCSRLHERGIIAEESIRHGWIASRLQDSAFWIPRWIGMRAWDNEWEGDWRQCLIVLFRLKPLELNVGYRLGFGGENLRQMFSGGAKSCGLSETLEAIPNYVVSFYVGDFVLTDRVVGENITKDTFSLQALGSATNLIIGCVFNHGEVASPKLLDGILECLVRMRDIVKENRLCFPKQAIESFTPHDTAGDMEEISIEGQTDEQESREE